MTAIPVAILGGPYDGARGTMTATPPRVRIGGHLHARVDDPDTGVFLGGYVALPAGQEPHP